MATAPSANDLTRQQLDELDALLQRMLSVPLATDAQPGSSAPAEVHAASRVSDDSSPDSAPPLPPSWRIDPSASAPAGSASAPAKPGGVSGNFASGPRETGATGPRLAVIDSPTPPPFKFEPGTPPPSTVTQTLAPNPFAKPTPVSVPAPGIPTATSKASPVLSSPNARVPAPPVAVPSAAAGKAERSLTPAPAAPPVAFPLLPLVALNTCFDAVCGLFGPPGRLFRSGVFKHLYGLIGLCLLIYTAAHIAQVRSWVTLPVSLPWPQ
jgi:hypothetical protein